jgi:RecJ-like exonuclease
MEADNGFWLILDWCDRCCGSGFIEACYECPNCDGTGQAWRPVMDDDEEEPDDEDGHEHLG